MIAAAAQGNEAPAQHGAPAEAGGPAAPARERLLAIVRDLALELHPRRRLRVGLDSDLERDLGLDSLGRAELLLRLERAFRVRLPERLLGEADTPQDLLAAVLAARAAGAEEVLPEARPPRLAAVEDLPAEARTLTEVLEWHVERHPERSHILLCERGAAAHPVTYRALAEAAGAVACGLRAQGLEDGDRVAIMLPTGAEFFYAFFGTLYAGGVPVPIYPPFRLSHLEEHLRRQAGILRNSQAAVLIAMPEARAPAALLRSQAESLRAVAAVADLRKAEPAELPRISRPEAPALLQYTSGSTGDPKGVVLSHTNLLSNIRAMGQTMEASSADVFVSWLPLYHDLGLIGAWLGTLYYAAPVVIMPPLDFLVRPERWLWAIHRYRATLSAAPNFAFELCLSKVDDAALQGLDLSSLRMVANGAEAVSPSTVRRFTQRFARYGFRPEAMAPVYGLAESAVGLAFPPAGRLPIIDRIQRDALAHRGEAVPARPDEPSALEFVACGRPLPGHEIRLVDATGHEVGERRQGRLQFRGPSATSGYFRNEAKTRELFDGAWLDSGDLAYMAGGDVFITGRVKDIIIRAGRNIYPHELEEAVGDIEGIRKGCVAVFASADPRTRTERIVVLAETRESEDAVLARLQREVGEAATDLLGAPADEVILAPPHSVPKTSSGKLRRAAARERYEAGQIGVRPRALWVQVARLALAGLQPQVRRLLRTLGDLLYAGYWWAVLAVLAGLAWPLVMVLPKRAWRWALIRAITRLGLRLMGIPLTVAGREHLPAAGGVLVANHSSYFDVFVLSAALGGEPVFAAKAEFAPQLFAGRFLRRTGALFVERRAPERGVEDTREAVARAGRGARLVFFPEGTLTRVPGLRPFHLGAFMTAAEAGAPVVPVTIRGTRSILRGGQWFPRRGRVSVEISVPLVPEGRGFDAAIKVRDAVRAAILANCGEPDLAD